MSKVKSASTERGDSRQSSSSRRHHRNRKRRRGFCNFIMTAVTNFIAAIRYYIDALIDLIFGYIYDSSKESVKAATNPIVLMSATELARKIRERKLTSEEVVQAFIDRTYEVNGVINAVVDNRFDEAIKEAQQIDRDIASGEIIDADFLQKPLLGVPFTTKESMLVKGMSSTFGIKVRKCKKANYDADCIVLVKEAGGILIGVTNVPQLNLWQETSNPVYGLTRNPYNTTRNVGGSSGGESSIIAACGSAFGIGTDIGGSIRMPAFMCGIYGHKPTSHLVPTRGMTFRTGKEKDTIVVCGPMTKHAEDLSLLLKVLLAENKNKLRLDDKVDVKEIQFYYVVEPNDPFISSIRTDMKRIFSSVVQYFREIATNEPEEVNFEGFSYGGKLWRYWMTQEENANFKRDIQNRENEVNTFVEIAKHVVGMGDLTSASVLNLLNGLLPKENAKWARDLTEQLKKQIIDTLGDNGVLLYPSAPWPASYHHTALLRPWNFNLFAIWNALKCPVTQVPLGLTDEGLPVGIQVVAAPYQDRLCLAVAKTLERQFGGYVPPS